MPSLVRDVAALPTGLRWAVEAAAGPTTTLTTMATSRPWTATTAMRTSTRAHPEIDNDIDDNCDGDVDDKRRRRRYLLLQRGLQRRLDASVHPGAADDTDNDIDDDCDVAADEDFDGSGALMLTAMGTHAAVDCDDSDQQVYPGATELDDCLDNNCDGFIDEGIINCNGLVVTVAGDGLIAGTAGPDVIDGSDNADTIDAGCGARLYPLGGAGTHRARGLRQRRHLRRGR